MSRRILTLVVLALATKSAAAQRFSVTFPTSRSATPLDGRLLVMISADTPASRGSR